MVRLRGTIRRLAALAAVTVAVGIGPRAATSDDPAPTAADVEAMVAKGRELLGASRVNEADAAFERAAEAARGLADARLEVAALKGRFDALGYRNEWSTLRDVAARLLAVQTHEGDRDGATDTEHDVGAIEAMLGNYRQADYYLRRVESYWAEKGDPKRRAESRLDIAKLREFEGKVVEAWTLADAARETFHAIGERALESDAARTLAGVHIVAGDYVDARRLAQQALDLLGEGAPDGDVAEARGLLAIVDYELGDLERARDGLLKVLDLYEGAKQADGACLALVHLAEVALRQEKPDAALAFGRRARAAAKDGADLVGWSLRAIGDALAAKGSHDAALKAFAEALAIAEQIRSPALALDVRRGMARTYLARGDLENALDQAGRACDLLEALASDLDDQHRTSLRATSAAEAYDLGIRAAVQRKDAAALASFLERARAGSLLQGLGGRRLLRGVGLPEELAAAEQGAREALVAAEAASRAVRAAGAGLDEVRRAAAAQAGAERRYDDVVARIQRDAHREAALSFPVAASLGELEASVWAGEALVLYALLPDEVVALVVTDRDARLVRLGARADLDPIVAAVVDRGAGSDPVTEAGLAAAATALLEPLRLPATVKTVLVSPDGTLANAPWPAMSLVAGTADRTIALVPSGSTYRLLLEDRVRTGTRILALGDPAYGGPDRAGAPGVAPPTVLAMRGGALARLPGTRAEVLAIAHATTDVQLLGGDATKRGLRAALAAMPRGQRWRAVHFACHGLINRERPGFCSLALAAGGGPDDDGFLTVHEIFASRIPADLVVLSACETALGRPERGEGILGFTRAFFNAGAPRVVVSLWAVDDDATRELMIAFYARLDAGAPPATALRDAQATVRAIPKWAHPRFWAAWELWGLAN